VLLVPSLPCRCSVPAAVTLTAPVIRLGRLRGPLNGVGGLLGGLVDLCALDKPKSYQRQASAAAPRRPMRCRLHAQLGGTSIMHPRPSK